MKLVRVCMFEDLNLIKLSLEAFFVVHSSGCFWLNMTKSESNIIRKANNINI